MIQANELRLGNYLKDEKGNFLKVDSLTNEDVYFIANPEHQPMEFKPIPLTEEVLLKCGFNKDVGEGLYTWSNSEGNLHFRIFSNGGCFEMWVGHGNLHGNTIQMYLEALHDLQNKVFALTNEELEINL